MSETPSYQRFFAELKRRKVFRTVALYGAAAFGILQAVDVLVDALRLPPSLTTIVALVAIAGFPLAVVLAWTFPGDIGRHAEDRHGHRRGDRRDRHGAGCATAGRRGSRPSSDSFCSESAPGGR